MYRASPDGSKKRNGDETTDMKRNFHRRLRHEDLRDRSGTSGITKRSSGCNKGKFTDWRAMWLGSEKFFRRCLNPKQMDATILVDNENKKWCLQNGIKKVTTGNGRTKANGKMNTRKYNRTHYRIPRTRCTTRKDIPSPERTRKNNVVLGMPRLKNENPRIN